MALTKADVLHVAKLAKLNIPESEIEKYSTQISEVVDYFEELKKVDTNDIQPTSQTTGLENVFRINEANMENCLTQEESLAGSDKIAKGYFKVKAILSERSDK